MADPKPVEIGHSWTRPSLLGCLENEEALRELTGYSGHWVVAAIESCYATLDLIDQQLLGKGAPPLAQTVELANLSSMLGNLLGAGLAEASSGGYRRNRPHAYPDLVPQRAELPPLEVKTALETNRPKGHLPKPGPHITFRYVLGDRAGNYAIGKERRGDTVWFWEARIGVLTMEDYDLSNTEGDSGKTAVIKTEVFKRMPRLLYVPDYLPYGRRTGPWGDHGIGL